MPLILHRFLSAYHQRSVQLVEMYDHGSIQRLQLCTGNSEINSNIGGPWWTQAFARESQQGTGKANQLSSALSPSTDPSCVFAGGASLGSWTSF